MSLTRNDNRRRSWHSIRPDGVVADKALRWTFEARRSDKSCFTDRWWVFVKFMTKTPTILFGLSPEHGAYNATFALARALLNRNYRIVYVVTPDFKEYVAENGFEYMILDPRLPTGNVKAIK